MTIREWRQRAEEIRRCHVEALREDEQREEHKRMARDPFSRIERRMRLEMERETKAPWEVGK